MPAAAEITARTAILGEGGKLHRTNEVRTHCCPWLMLIAAGRWQSPVDRPVYTWTRTVFMVTLFSLSPPSPPRVPVRYVALAACAFVALAAVVCAAVTVSRRESHKDLTTRLQRLRQQFGTVEKNLHLLPVAQSDRIEARQVTSAVISKFIPLVQEDLEHEELTRAATELTALERMLNRLAQAKTPGPKATISHARDISAAPGRRLKVRDGTIVVANPLGGEADHSPSQPLFLTGYSEFQQVRDDVDRMPAFGANLVQLEIGPWYIFPKADVVETRPIHALVEVLERAAKAGVAVDVLLSPHLFPEWMLESVPGLRKRPTGFMHYCIHHPAGRELLQRYVRMVIGAIKDQPALFSVCLANEPGSAEEKPCELAQKGWHAWLNEHHGNVEAFNRAHGTHMRTLNDVPLPNPYDPPPKDRALWNDYIRFNAVQEIDWLAMLAATVHDVAPDLPVHVKALANMPSGFGPGPADGNDPTLLARVGNLNGNDTYNLFQYGSSDFAESWQSSKVAYDLQKSLSPAPIFNSENHIILDRDTRDTPPSHVRAALWQAAVHGQTATTIWVWERSYDRQSDFWGSILERPEAVEAVGLTNIDLNRAAPEIVKVQESPADVTILSGTSALVWDDKVPAITEALYTALSFNGLKIGFVTERQLENRIEVTTPILFVPGTVHVSQEALQSLAGYRGRVVFVGSDQLLSRDDHDHPTTLKIPADILGNAGANSWRGLWQELTVALARWKAESPVQVSDANGQALWGVEWRSTHHATDACIVNLCNYRHDSVTIQLRRHGRAAHGIDVLTGLPLQARTVLRSLETKLIRLD